MKGKGKKEIPYELYNMISFVASVLGIPSSFVAIFAVLKAIINKEYTYLVASIPSGILLIICIILSFRFLIYKKKLVCLSQTYPDNFGVFMSKCRNCYFEIIKKHSHFGDKSKENIVEELSIFIKNQTQELLDSISEIYGKITSENICSCIKLITTIEEGQPLLIQTLSRSTNTDNDRKLNDDKPYPLLGNTDFEHIFNDGHSYFYSKNLEEYDKSLKKSSDVGYENNSHNYTDTTKRYNSTVVVPLKVDKSYLDDKSVGDRLLGFLCIDSISTNAFRDDDESMTRNVHLLEAFAASLVIILEKYQFYLNS